MGTGCFWCTSLKKIYFSKRIQYMHLLFFYKGDKKMTNLNMLYIITSGDSRYIAYIKKKLRSTCWYMGHRVMSFGWPGAKTDCQGSGHWRGEVSLKGLMTLLGPATLDRAPWRRSSRVTIWLLLFITSVLGPIVISSQQWRQALGKEAWFLLARRPGRWLGFRQLTLGCNHLHSLWWVYGWLLRSTCFANSPSFPISFYRF